MKEQMEFREKLAGILALGKERGDSLSREEVETYFAGEHLTAEQMELVFEYLMSQKILVRGYIKAGGRLKTARPQEQAEFSGEDMEFLQRYEQELREMPGDQAMTGWLKKILEMAKEIWKEGVFLGDLVQEGSVGLMAAVEEGTDSEEELLRAAGESMKLLLENQTEVRLQDQRMADRVNELDEQISRLAEELGRKVSIDELAQFTERTEEEILEIMKLAGEELEEEE